MSQVSAVTEILRSEKDGDFLAAGVDSVHVEAYLEQMRTHLGVQEFERYSRNQRERDGLHYHVTVVAPCDYAALDPRRARELVSRRVSLELEGLGRASADRSEAYFVIVSSADLGCLRNELGLDPVEFHATLGFRDADVHGVPKGAASAI